MPWVVQVGQEDNLNQNLFDFCFGLICVVAVSKLVNYCSLFQVFLNNCRSGDHGHGAITQSKEVSNKCLN